MRAYNELPDLIISDVVMTGINGYQLCRLVKNDSGAVRHSCHSFDETGRFHRPLLGLEVRCR